MGLLLQIAHHVPEAQEELTGSDGGLRVLLTSMMQLSQWLPEEPEEWMQAQLAAIRATLDAGGVPLGEPKLENWLRLQVDAGGRAQHTLLQFIAATTAGEVLKAAEDAALPKLAVRGREVSGNQCSVRRLRVCIPSMRR